MLVTAPTEKGEEEQSRVGENRQQRASCVRPIEEGALAWGRVGGVDPVEEARIDSPSWMRVMASAKSLLTDRT